MVHRRYVLMLAALTLGLFVALVVSLRSDGASQTASADPEWLFALTTTSGSMRSNDEGTFTLTLHESDGTRAIAFTDRPDRLVAHISFGDFLSDWDDYFADVPPNAALVTEGADGQMTTMIVELSAPRVIDEALTFVARDIDPDTADHFTHDRADAPVPASDLEFLNASLFIDQLHCTGWLPGTGHCFDDGTGPPPSRPPSDRFCWGGWFGDLSCSDGTGRWDTSVPPPTTPPTTETPAPTTTVVDSTTVTTTG